MSPRSMTLVLRKGTRVIIPAVPSCGFVEERGICESDWDPVTETVVVRVDPQYTKDPWDDGLREVTSDDVLLPDPEASS